MSERLYEDLRAARTGDREAAGRLIEENSGLIWSVARRYFGRGADPDDLYQLGCLGFLKAVEGFDEDYGTRFSTYAVPKIAGEIRRFLRDDSIVKVSRGVKEQAAQIHSARQRLEQRLGREPTLSELSRETGLAPEDIAFAETATGPAESLQRESGEDGFTLELVLGDYGAEERLVERVTDSWNRLTQTMQGIAESAKALLDAQAHELTVCGSRLQHGVLSRIHSEKEHHVQIRISLQKDLAHLVRNESIRLNRNEEGLRQGSRKILDLEKSKFELMDVRVRSVDPQTIIAKGYTLTTGSDGKFIRSASDLKSGDVMRTRFRDGSVESIVR